MLPGVQKPGEAFTESPDWRLTTMQKKHSRERKVSLATKQKMRTPNFEVWKWNHEELILLLKEIYEDLGLISALNINRNTLQRFLTRVEQTYRDNPFHNFRHCFCVTQMMFVLVTGLRLHERCFSPRNVAVLITACICHDLDHPGLSNSYQVNARTELCQRYGGDSPLEKHHRDQSIRILTDQNTNIFHAFSKEENELIRSEISSLILATDMSRHDSLVQAFEAKLVPGFDFSSHDSLEALKIILVKACDVSNECRPLKESEAWADRLLREYFEQSDKEKLAGLPFQPFMDREKVTKTTSQISFIKSVLIPMFESLKKLFPEIESLVLENLRKSLEYYENLHAT